MTAIPDSLLLELTQRYCELHRDYHGIAHIADMLQRGRSLGLGDEQVMAIWFHDAIYDPTRSDNEEQSAELAVARLTARGWSPERVSVVADIVRDTKGHVPSRPESALVIDLDLSSLAAPWERFAANSIAIRREYAHVPEAAFAQGRREFLGRMLARERLYWTPFGEVLEPLARANLARACALP